MPSRIAQGLPSPKPVIPTLPRPDRRGFFYWPLVQLSPLRLRGSSKITSRWKTSPASCHPQGGAFFAAAAPASLPPLAMLRSGDAAIYSHRNIGRSGRADRARQSGTCASSCSKLHSADTTSGVLSGNKTDVCSASPGPPDHDDCHIVLWDPQPRPNRRGFFLPPPSAFPARPCAGRRWRYRIPSAEKRTDLGPEATQVDKPLFWMDCQNTTSLSAVGVVLPEETGDPA